MKALPLLLLASLVATSSAALAQRDAQFTLSFDQQPLLQTQAPDVAVPHYLPTTFGAADHATQPVPAGPQPVWTPSGLALEEKESQAVVVVPWMVNGGEQRMDSQYLYPLHFGDVSADLGSSADALASGSDGFLAIIGVPEVGLALVPTIADATGAPDLVFGLSLRQGDVGACVGECIPAVVDHLRASVDAPGSFLRASSIGAEEFAIPASDLRYTPSNVEGLSASPATGAPASTAPLDTSAQQAAPLSLLPAVDAGLAAVAVALGALLLAAPIALYSKIRRDSTLENDTRRAIYESVVATPGLSIQDVARRASVSHSTAAYHLERLGSAGLVVATGDGNKVRYYRNGGRFTEAERKLLPILENVETVRVLEAVLDGPWTYRAEIAQKLGVTATTVNWHLKRLFGCGMLTERREGRNAYLFVERGNLILTLAGLKEKLSPSPPREIAEKLLAKIAPDGMPPSALTLPSVAPSPSPSSVSPVPVPVASPSSAPFAAPAPGMGAAVVSRPPPRTPFGLYPPTEFR